ncbi:hypothetical protein MM2B0626_4693 [Mycobacteroides abscessus subsp. bolletii 2B-0626]|nr:hypothetical protein MM2B0626_4693 [Mycobacteroides abscessus subsp. bolletii 2B-0626]ETZ84397.1 hypothetical protein L834_4640 [Mycobacteroides abscessus MAB_091912_2455]
MPAQWPTNHLGQLHTQRVSATWEIAVIGTAQIVRERLG